MKLGPHHDEIGAQAKDEKMAFNSNIASNIIDELDGLQQLDATLIYRTFASLTICFIIQNNTESELAILDLIQFTVEVLDKQFDNNVSEIDMVFNPDKVHYAFDEIIMDGIVISVDVEETVKELEIRKEALALE